MRPRAENWLVQAAIGHGAGVSATAWTAGLRRSERTVSAPDVVPPAGLDVPRPGGEATGGILRLHAADTAGYVQDAAVDRAETALTLFGPGTDTASPMGIRTLLAADQQPPGFEHAHARLAARLAERSTVRALSEDELTVAALAVCAQTRGDEALAAATIDHLVGIDLAGALRGEGAGPALQHDEASHASAQTLRLLGRAGGAGPIVAASLLSSEAGPQPDAAQLRTLARAADAFDPARRMPSAQWMQAAQRVERTLLEPMPSDHADATWPSDQALRAAGVSPADLERRVPALAIGAVRAALAQPDQPLTPQHAVAYTLARSGLMTPKAVAGVDRALQGMVASARQAQPAGYLDAMIHPRLPSVDDLPPLNAGDGLLTVQRGAMEASRHMFEIGRRLQALGPAAGVSDEENAVTCARLAFLQHQGWDLPFDSQLRHRVVRPEEAIEIGRRAAEFAGRPDDAQFASRAAAWAREQLRSPETLQREFDRTMQALASVPATAQDSALADSADKLQASMREALHAPPQQEAAARRSAMQALAAEIERFELATTVRLRTSHTVGLVDPLAAAAATIRLVAQQPLPPAAFDAGGSVALSRESELEANLGAHGVELAFRMQNKAVVRANSSISGPRSVAALRMAQGETRTWAAGPGSVLYVRLPRRPEEEDGVAAGERGFRGDRTRAHTMAEVVRQLEQLAQGGDHGWAARLAQRCPQLSFTLVSDPSSETEMSRNELDLAVQSGFGQGAIGAATVGMTLEARPESRRQARPSGGAVDLERQTMTESYRTGLQAKARLGPAVIRPLADGRVTLHQGGTVVSTIVTRNDDMVRAADSYRTARFQTLAAALAHFDRNIDTYAGFSLGGDGRVNAIVEARVDQLLEEPAIHAAGVDRDWLMQQELGIERAARAEELRANIQDTPRSNAKTYTSYELMKAEVADRLNALLAVSALSRSMVGMEAAETQADAEFKRLANAELSYKPVVIYEAQRETSTDELGVSHAAFLDVKVAWRCERARAST
jgi:hypothetical protein